MNGETFQLDFQNQPFAIHISQIGTTTTLRKSVYPTKKFCDKIKSK